MVLNSGDEVDLDFGTYERTLGVRLTHAHNLSMGKTYRSVIEKERRGEYLGATVQMVPHVSDELEASIDSLAHIPVDPARPGLEPDVLVIELGGTVGDIESILPLEALRRMRYRMGSENFAHVHVVLVPGLGPLEELKTKLAQHAVAELRKAGHSPDLLFCRSPSPLPPSIKTKLSQFCSLPAERVISMHDLSSLYRLPIVLADQGVGHFLLQQLGHPRDKEYANSLLRRWEALATQEELPESKVRIVKIALVGKYVGSTDSYMSVVKALEHAGAANGVRVKLSWISAGDLEDETLCAEAMTQLHAADGVLVPGGFGVRGTEGLVRAINYARTQKVPFFGVCLGFQLAVVEYARNVLGWTRATSAEFDTDDKSGQQHVIVNMPEISSTHLGGTMRLGSRTASLTPGTLASQIYGGATQVDERHRHRYEVNPVHIKALADAGLVFGAVDHKEHVRMECLELSEHPFFFGTQSHPEFNSGPFAPSAPFCAFVAAASARRQLK